MVNLLWYAIFGLVVGAIANWLDPRPSEGGVLGSIVLGIVGAVVGGYLGEAFFGVGVSGFNLPSILVAVTGALLVMFVMRMFRGRTV